MGDTKSGEFFGKEASQTYDERANRIAPIARNLHFLIQLILKELSHNSRVLCVGVGTGSEILALGEAFPGWKFKGVDPSGPMLDVCRERLKERGMLDRCELVHGNLSDVAIEKFDAVLCLLVGHFVRKGPERQALFQAMAERLKPGGYLVHAEISIDFNVPEFESLVEKWNAMQRHAGASEEALSTTPQVLKEVLSVLPPESTEDLIRKSGLPMPVQFFQSLLIRGWYAVNRPARS